MDFTISEISQSGIGPGPLGILPTSPNASAPCSIANFASYNEEMQQIFILVRMLIIKISKNNQANLSINFY
jgi:hypothetical protein